MGGVVAALGAGGGTSPSEGLAVIMRAKLLAVATRVLAFTGAVAAPAQAGWTTSTSVVPGRYADAEVFRLPDGRYRTLYGTEREVAADRSGIYASIGSDGKTWMPEAPAGWRQGSASTSPARRSWATGRG